MGKLVVTSHFGSFFRKNAAFVDMVKGHMAMDIEIALKTTAGMPVKTGNMKSQTRHFRNPSGGFRVEVDTVYAAAQEAGFVGKTRAKVKNYTTPGTSAGFFMRAIESVTRNRERYIKEAARAVGL